MLLLIDNYDSFTYIRASILVELGCELIINETTKSRR